LGFVICWCLGYQGVTTLGVPDIGALLLPVSRTLGGSQESPVSRFSSVLTFFKLQVIATAFKATIVQKTV